MKKIFGSIKNNLGLGKKEVKRNFIFQAILDLFLLYKNFIHWNLSKIIIFIYSVIIGFISVIPFILIFFIYSFFSDVNMGMLINGMFSGTLLFNIIGNIILFLIIFTYFVVFSYSNILIFRLNNGYLSGNKIEYKNEIFKDYIRFIKFIKLALINLTILLVPFLIFAIVILILFAIAGSINGVLNIVKSGAFNFFTIFSLIFAFIGILSLVYLYYKTVFSFLLFADDNFYSKDKKVIEYIKESFKKTKGINKILKFATLIVLFIIIIAPINYIGKVFDNNGKYINDYINYLSLTDKQKESLSSEGIYYYESLKTEFKGLTISDLEKESKLNLVYAILFSIFNFIFIYGLFLMVFSSFYRKEILK